jgi:iron complex outermembrane receptor protein
VAVEDCKINQKKFVFPKTELWHAAFPDSSLRLDFKKTLLRGWLKTLSSVLLTEILACINALPQEAPADGSAAGQTAKTVPPQNETVVVTGTFVAVAETELDRSVSVIEFQPYESLYSDWTDALALVPSVDLRQRAVNDIQADLSIRGSSFGQTLVLLNGLCVDDVQTGHHDMDLPLPSSSIERLEILRGAGSTLYGSDAMAGSLNVITRRRLSLMCGLASG